MSKINGYWIYIDIKPSDYVANGIPKLGDPVKLEYDKDHQPWSGSIQLIGSNTDTAIRSYEAKEYGASFIFSGNF